LSGDESTAELVEISEEFANTDALLRAVSSDSSDNIVQVLGAGAVLHGLVSDNARLSLGEEVPGVVEISTDSEEVGGSINVFAEVDVVDLINVTLVHVSTEDLGGYGFGGRDAQKVEHSEELHLGDVTVLGNIEILEDGLEVHASLLDGISVLSNNVVHVNGVVVLGQVLAAGKEGVVVRLSVNSGKRSLINSSDGEGLVDAGSECNIVEENFGVVSFVSVAKGLEFIVGQIEVHG
jgi:hypothetical protein